MTRTDAFSLALVAALILTMPIFAVRSRDRARDAEVQSRGKTALLGYWVRDWLMWVIAPLERAIVAARLAPDLFNLAGVAMGLAAGVAYAGGALPLGGWLVLAGGLCDVLDGRVARARGMVSRYGSFLDSTLDRFAETFAFAGLVVYFSADPRRALVTALALAGSLLVSYARARGEALGVSCRGGLMQRAERLVVLALASLLDPWAARLTGSSPGGLVGVALVLIAAGSLGTAVYRTVAIAGMLKRGDAPER